MACPSEKDKDYGLIEQDKIWKVIMNKLQILVLGLLNSLQYIWTQTKPNSGGTGYRNFLVLIFGSTRVNCDDIRFEVRVSLFSV